MVASVGATRSARHHRPSPCPTDPFHGTRWATMRAMSHVCLDPGTAATRARFIRRRQDRPPAPSRSWSSTTSSAMTAPGSGPGPTTPSAASTGRPWCSATASASARGPGRRCCTPTAASAWSRGTTAAPAARPGPRTAARVGIEEFVEDALSVMDHFGVDRAVLMGWSMGVNTAFELALRHPERVTGIFAVAGVPGDTFATMLGPVPPAPRGRPRRHGRPVPAAQARPAAPSSPVTTRLPVGAAPSRCSPTPASCCPTAGRRADRARRARVPEHPGRVVLPPGAAHLRARPGLAEPGQGAGDARRGDLRRAGRRPRHAHAYDRLEDATYVELRASHFVQMEQPEVGATTSCSTSWRTSRSTRLSDPVRVPAAGSTVASAAGRPGFSGDP